VQPPQRIDLLSSIDAVSFAEVWKNSDVTRMTGQQMRVIGLAELKKNKAAAGRRKDEEDVRRLMSRGTRNKQ
jgi:predicted nucleotidyltransferase